MRHPHQVLSREQSNRHSGSGGNRTESNAVTTMATRQRLQQLEPKIGWKQSRYGLPPKPSIAQAESVPDLCLVVVVAIWLVGSHCQSILIVFAGVVYHREVEDHSSF